MNVTIRVAAESDAVPLATLSTQLGYPASSEVMRERLRYKPDPNRALFVAESGNEVVGCLEVAVMFAWETGEWAEIRGLVVLDSARSLGIGGKLVAHAKEWAHGRGHTKLRVRTNEVRTRTHEFYERLGFMKTKSQRVYDISLGV
ncbi:MAG: GNAT family N-acetyltransferase [Phycisphaeraceae bacterium]|nr:GNAT family N-acetyltransferase [Phycisphaeraceae bacterium]